MIQFHLLLLLLFLLELQAHELVLLVSNGSVLHSLTLKLLVLVLQIAHDIFELLDTLRLCLLFLLLSLILSRKLSVKPFLELLILCCELFLELAKLL